MTSIASAEYPSSAPSSVTSNTTPTKASQLHSSSTHNVPGHPPSSASSMSSMDFTSPSAYLNHEAYNHTSHPSTPQTVPPHTLVSGQYMQSHQPGSMEDQFAFSYGSGEGMYQNQNGGEEVGNGIGSMDHSTPSAPTAIDDDRTPIVSDIPHPIPPSALPCPPGQNQNQNQKPLMSPFRPFHQSGITYPPNHHQSQINASPTYYDPNTGTHMYTPMSGYYDDSPSHQPYMQVVIPPSFNFQNDMPQATAGPVPGQQAYYSQPQPHSQTTFDFGPPPTSSGSGDGSPNSTLSSSAASLTRSTSIQSEMRPRPKVKLTFEDKRNIVELHRANSSLRQEDIARQYGVDRSTISKIILSAHRWTQPHETQAPVLPKVMKTVGGRFPAIEEMMHRWMDQEIAAGRDVRDNVARDQAKIFAKQIGFPMERFKASAKWLDKFKDRRRMSGKPTTSPMHMSFGYYPYGNMPYPSASPMSGSVMLSRSQSALTLASSDSSNQEMFQPSPGMVPSPGFLPLETVTTVPIHMTKSDTDLTHLESSTPHRQRSQSSPQVLGEPAMLTPSSGKAVRPITRPSPFSLQRQNSYHGTSPSPRRPTMISRANSSQGPGAFKRPRPTSLAASAFGITPLGGDDAYSPMISPSTSASSVSGGHSRQRSEISLTPFTQSVSSMTISPDMSDGEVSMGMNMSIPPLTPITPAGSAQSSGAAVFPNIDYGDLQTHDSNLMTTSNGTPIHAYHHHQHIQQQHHHHHHQQQHAISGFPAHLNHHQQQQQQYQSGGGGQYATMPNKHFTSHHPYTAGYPVTDFGPAVHHGQQPQHATQWQ